MKAAKRDNEMILEFPERVTSVNAPELAADAEKLIAGEKNVTVDLDNTTYISSAGLRVILTIKKKGHDVKVVNVSSEVYEVFEVTGFSEILPVTRKRRRISLEGAQQIGAGFFSRVYQLDADTIVKVFIQDTSLEDIHRELNLAKRAFVLGVPTAISYDVVDVEDKIGVVFELLGVGTMKEHLLKHPDDREALIGKYVKMMKIINTTDARNTDLPHADEIARKKLDAIRNDLTAEESARMAALLDTVPKTNTFVHGDCHIKNVMISGEELLIIDMETLCVGNPIFELAGVFSVYELFEWMLPGDCAEFLGVDYSVCHHIWERLSREYFSDVDEAALQRNRLRIDLAASMHMVYWLKTFIPENTASREAFVTRIRELLPKVESLSLEGL